MVLHAHVNFQSRKYKKKILVKILASELPKDYYTLPKSPKQNLYKQQFLLKINYYATDFKEVHMNSL